jgi:serine O-acetyltransferase
MRENAVRIAEVPEACRPPVEDHAWRARDCFREDFKRYVVMAGATTPLARLKIALRTEALWAIGSYRFGQYLHREAPRPLRAAMRLPHAIVHRALEWTVGIHLSHQTNIGPGLYIGHYGGIWISPRARLGASCNINHHVTIGVAGRQHGAPELGDRVWVGPGAVVSGPVHVGSDAVIGANSLVVANVPESGVAVGVPARVVSRTGSGKLIRSDLTLG